MKLHFIALLFFIGVFSESDCDYGRFETSYDYNSNEFESTFSASCMFDCEHKNNYIEIEDVSFDAIKESCTNVELASSTYPDECNSLDDLVFPSDYGYCECPYCKCSTKNEEGESTTIISYDYGPQKECESCKCSASAINYGIDDMVYECDKLMEVDDPIEWYDFKCPPESCTETSYGGYTNERDADDTWWKDVGDSDTLCREFCYCSGTDGKICETGYENIMANDKLFYKFMYTCGRCHQAAACYDMDTQSYDTSRLFTTDSGPYCSIYSCPKCDCDGRDVGDKWYVEYQDYWELSYNGASCAECECKTDSYGNNYADCDDMHYYIVGTQSCPPEDVYSCHDDYDGDSASVGTLSSDECYSGLASGYNYCEWFASENDDSDMYYGWECGSGAICEAFSDGKCTYIDLDFEYDDCGGNMETSIIKQYTYCCRSGDNCNHMDIDISSCTRSTAFEDLYKEYWDCLYDYDNDAGDILCDDNVDEITCNDLLTIYRKESKCICNVYVNLYDRVSFGSKTILQKDIDAAMEQYSEWNDVLGCDINLECNLAEGGVVTNNSGISQLVYFIGLMWTVLVGLYVSS